MRVSWIRAAEGPATSRKRTEPKASVAERFQRCTAFREAEAGLGLLALVKRAGTAGGSSGAVTGSWSIEAAGEPELLRRYVRSSSMFLVAPAVGGSDSGWLGARW